ncbi:RNA polymerase sigma factor [Amycolatopsis japonica]
MSDSAGDTMTPSRPELEEAFRRWREPLCQYALDLAVRRGLPRSADCAEDVVQQAFEAALRADWDSIQYPRAWLYAVTRNMILHSVQRWRVENRSPSPTGKVVWTSQTRLPSTAVAHAVSVATEEIAALPGKQAAVFYLRAVLGYSYAEIAEEIGITESTARVHANHARMSLRENVFLADSAAATEDASNTTIIEHLGDAPFIVYGTSVRRRRTRFGLWRILSARPVAAALIALSTLILLAWWLL